MKHALLRIREGAALAAAALLRRARLVVDEHRHAPAGPRPVAQLPLHLVEIVAMPHRHAGLERDAPVLLRLVGDDRDPLDAFGRNLIDDHRHVERAVETLAAGHRDRVVVENLVGDRHFRRDGGADREQTRVVVRPVAEVGEDMPLRGERRLADPRARLRRPCG